MAILSFHSYIGASIASLTEGKVPNPATAVPTAANANNNNSVNTGETLQPPEKKPKL